MKNLITVLMISILTATGCFAQKNTNEPVDNSVLNFYRQYSPYTDPGEYEYLYANLPDTLPALCSLIKSQFIHAYGELNKYRDQIPDFHTSHAICEVWDVRDRRWMLVDPSMDMIDFSRDKFDISNEAWIEMQNGEIDPDQYGIPRRYSGMGSILAKLCADLACILGTEYPITQYPPIMDYIFEEGKQFPTEHIELLNRISELMNSIDAENLSELQDIYNNNPEIQITKSF